MLATRLARLVAGAWLAVAVLLAGSPVPPLPDVAPSALPVVAAATPEVLSAPVVVRRVVVISVDGLRSDAITRLGPERLPNLYRLLREGAGTLNARNLVELTITLPNHTSMVTGRPVALDAGGHGVRANRNDGRTVHDAAGEYVASVFDVVHDHGGSTGLYVGKTKFDFLDRSWDAAHGAPDEIGVDDGTDKISVYRVGDPAAEVAAQLVSADPFEFSFVHLRYPDSAGHAHDWMSAQYLRAVIRADAAVGVVLAAIDASPQRTADTVVVLTADHGGYGDRHDVQTRLEDYRIPFLTWGAGVAAGADLYELNPARTDPGDGRPGYSGPQPIRNGEVANLATGLLGLPPVPGSVFDADQDLRLSAATG